MSKKLNALFSKVENDHVGRAQLAAILCFPKELMREVLEALDESTPDELTEKMQALYKSHIVEVPNKNDAGGDSRVVSDYPKIILQKVKNLVRIANPIEIRAEDKVYTVRIDVDSLTAEFTNHRRHTILFTGLAYIATEYGDITLKINTSIHHISTIDPIQVHREMLQHILPNSFTGSTWYNFELPDVWLHALRDSINLDECKKYLNLVNATISLGASSVAPFFRNRCVESLKHHISVKDRVSPLFMEKIRCIHDIADIISIEETDGIVIGKKDDFILVKQEDDTYMRVTKTDPMYKRCQLSKQLMK